MANNLNIVEVTLAQAGDSTHAVNTDGWWDRAHVIRITDHVSDITAETDDAERMAIFERKSLGHPWQRRGTKLGHVIHQAVTAQLASIPTNVEVLYPDWDYSTY